MTEGKWKRFDFEREKFIELLLYFSARGVQERLVIGSTKLNKLLFFADMRSYAELGEPITGARYQRLPLGPAARAMLPVRGELLETGQAEFETRPADDLSDVIVPLRSPNLSLFTSDELRIANEVFEELRPFNAKAVSDYSHLRSAGWKITEDKEDIPYESVFVSTEPAPQEAIELGRRLAAQYGW